MTKGTDPADSLTHQADEAAPFATTAASGLQHALLSMSGMVLIPAAAFRAAGATDSIVVWAVFASLLISGATIALHARPIGRFGAGYVLASGPTSAAIAVTVDAINVGGVSLLALLVVTAAAFQFAFAFKMSLLRRLLTPTVSGTALMLIPVSILPLMFDMFDDVPGDLPVGVSSACAIVTIVVIGGITLVGSNVLRTWAPLLGIAIGSMFAAVDGLYDFERIALAPWLGAPTQWPAHFASGFEGLDFEAFAGLAPGFVLLFLICTIRTMSSALAIQSVSWRRRRALDFRAVQGAVALDALSNLAAGLAGTMPNGAQSVTVARTQLTGIASRSVGVVYGAVIVVVAFCPKAVALVLAVPTPVFAGYATVMLATTFAIGMRMVTADGVDHRQGLIVGLAFWFGAGCQYGFIFPEFVADFAGGMLKSALAAGGILAILLTALLLLVAPRRERLEVNLAVSALPALQEFAREFAARHRWPSNMADRLDAVVEESLLTLIGDDEGADGEQRRLLALFFNERDAGVVEFMAAGGQENIEDRLAVLSDTATDESIERNVSLKLLRHLAAEVRHRQYHDVDILTARIARPA